MPQIYNFKYGAPGPDFWGTGLCINVYGCVNNCVTCVCIARVQTNRSSGVWFVCEWSIIEGIGLCFAFDIKEMIRAGPKRDEDAESRSSGAAILDGMLFVSTVVLV